MNKKTSLIIIILALLIVLKANLSYATNNVLVEADKQVYNGETNSGTFEGNVKVKFNDITVKSPKALLKTDKDGKPQTASFIQGAQAIKESSNSTSEIKANIIKVSLIENNIEAKGNTKLTILENKKPIVIIKANDQEFDMANNIMTATGNVKINYNNLNTTSSKAKILINSAGKPEKINLTGEVKIIQDKSSIKASSVLYNVLTEELTASGNTQSETTLEDTSHVTVTSDYQSYNKISNTIMAGGNVKIIYQDYIATGPKAVFLSDSKTSKPNKIVFIGRAKIQEGPRQVEANKIQITINPKNFTAEGNVKTKFVQVKNLDNNSSKKDNLKKSKETVPFEESSESNVINKDIKNIKDIQIENQQDQK